MIRVEISKEQRVNYRTDTGILDCWAWAMEHFGKPGTRWYWDTYCSFFFQDSRDALLFQLRWA